MVSSVLPPLCPKKVEEEDKLVLCNACGSSGKDECNCPIHCQPKQDNEDNGKKIPILWMSRIPSKKRTPKLRKRLTQMQMFHRQLLQEYLRQNNSSEEEEEVLMIHDMHNLIPRNEIGLGCVLLKPNCYST